jgi:hypothetical protein
MPDLSGLDLLAHLASSNNAQSKDFAKIVQDVVGDHLVEVCFRFLEMNALLSISSFSNLEERWLYTYEGHESLKHGHRSCLIELAKVMVQRGEKGKPKPRTMVSLQRSLAKPKVFYNSYF